MASESLNLETTFAPRLAFLGFCDRLAEIRSGHPLLWYTDLIGISNNRVSHVFPFNLRGHKLVVAVYCPREGDEFKIIFRSVANQQPFEITLKVGITQYTAEEIPAVHDKPAVEGLVTPGWVLVANEISADVIVNEPGNYSVYYSADGDDKYVGAVVLAHASVPPLTKDDIAAIRSDPLGAKHIRLSIACKLCGGSLKAYSGLEKMNSLENEGWLWSQEIRQDNFICKCGKTSFSLIPIRTGLHGLLRRTLSPTADSLISTVRQYEKSALEESCRRFFDLIKATPDEEKVQKFLEANPIFFHPFLPEKLMFKKPVLTKYFVDFAILNNRQELLLVEIERPGLRLLKKDGGITAGLQHALDQVRNWIRVFNDHRVAALDGFNLNVDEVAKVRGIVIAGRKPSDEVRARALRSASWGEIEVFTYDDLLRGTTEIIKRVASV